MQGISIDVLKLKEGNTVDVTVIGDVQGVEWLSARDAMAVGREKDPVYKHVEVLSGCENGI